MVQTVPRQLEKGVNEKEEKMKASSARNSFGAIIVIEIILSVFLKGVIDDLWNLFLIL